MKKLYLVIVLGDVEPILAGPFETEQMRDDHAAFHGTGRRVKKWRNCMNFWQSKRI